MVAGIARSSISSNDSSKPTTSYSTRLKKKSRGGRSDDDLGGYCLPERRFITLRSDSSICSSGDHHTSERRQCLSPVSGILDSFTCLCFGGGEPNLSSFNDGLSSRHKNAREQEKGAIVYPIAKYNARLNSKKLVDQRLKRFQHQFFRPVVAPDELSNRPRTS